MFKTPPHISVRAGDEHSNPHMQCCCSEGFECSAGIHPMEIFRWISVHTACAKKLSREQRRVILKADIDMRLAQARHYTEIRKAAGLHDPRKTTKGSWGTLPEEAQARPP